MSLNLALGVKAMYKFIFPNEKLSTGKPVKK